MKSFPDVLRPARALLASLAVLLVLPLSAAAAVTQSPLGSQTLGRGYTHMFIAYALAWLLVFGWLFSITRRLSRVERELDR